MVGNNFGRVCDRCRDQTARAVQEHISKLYLSVLPIKDQMASPCLAYGTISVQFQSINKKLLA